jgi:hypothetical protein
MLTQFETWGKRSQPNLADIIGPELWSRYWAKLEEVEQHMRDAQAMADEIRTKVQRVSDKDEQ